MIAPPHRHRLFSEVETAPRAYCSRSVSLGGGGVVLCMWDGRMKGKQALWIRIRDRDRNLQCVPDMHPFGRRRKESCLPRHRISTLLSRRNRPRIEKLSLPPEVEQHKYFMHSAELNSTLRLPGAGRTASGEVGPEPRRTPAGASGTTRDFSLFVRP